MDFSNMRACKKRKGKLENGMILSSKVKGHKIN